MQETRLRVAVSPAAAANSLGGWSHDELLVRVAAPPREGKANLALERFLARILGVGRGSVEVVRGLTSRHKIVVVRGLDRGEVLERLIAHAGTPDDAGCARGAPRAILRGVVQR